MSKEWSRREIVAAGLGAPVALAACKGPSLPQPSSPAASTPSASGSSPAPRARALSQVVAAQPTSDGAGVKLKRALGTGALAMVDPFLMLDEIRTDRPDEYIAGFPEHPHRGFETVTYMIDGAMEHRDSVGNHGRLGPGSLQWMTAGRGIVHSEMPRQERGLLWGFQLWVNLPATQKMIRPRYQDLAPSLVPEVQLADCRARVLAGELGGQRGPVTGIVTAPLFVDVTIPRGGRFTHALPAAQNAFLYVLTGRAEVGSSGRPVATGEVGVLAASTNEPFTLAGAAADEGTRDHLEVRAKEGARFLLFAGRPTREPVARYGPFVMNTEAELRQAFEDYRTGRLVEG